MAKCSCCGERYNKQETADRILDFCGGYSESDFGDLCFDCAVAHYIDLTGEDPLETWRKENEYDDEEDGAALATWREMVEESPFLDED